MIATAEEIVNRPAGHLADDVPTGELDGRNGVAMNLPTVGVEVAGHTLKNRLDLKRVHALVTRGELMHGRLDGAGEGVERALSDAVEPRLVRVQSHEEPVLPGIPNDVRRRTSDLHAPSRGDDVCRVICLDKISRLFDSVLDRGRSGTRVSDAARVRGRIGVDPRRSPVIKIMDDGFVAHDSGAGRVASGWIHQPGVGRVHMIDRFVPPSIAVGLQRATLPGIAYSSSAAIVEPSERRSVVCTHAMRTVASPCSSSTFRAAEQ